MRLNHFARHALVLTLAAGLAACGDDDSTGPGDSGDDLTEAETQLMMEALVDAGGFFVVAGGGGPAAVDIEQQTVPCPEGGNITLDGEYDVNQQTGDFSWTITQVHNSCVATASNGSSWTFNGNPNVTVDFDLTVVENEGFDMHGTQDGAIAWNNGSKSGSCSIDLTYDFSASQSGSTYSGEVSGTVCGTSYSYSTSFSD